jgi:flagellar biogenesis protein FliO
MQIYKKTSSRQSLIGIVIKLTLFLLFILGLVFFLNKIEFPAPKKDIQKIIPNEKFKIVK